MGELLQLCQAFREELDLRLEPLERPLFPEQIDVRDRRGTGEGVSGVGMAVEEGAELPVFAEERPVDSPPLSGSPQAEGNRR